MNLQSTKKLLEELKTNPCSLQDEEPLFSWHANLLNINHRKCLLMMNDKTRYSILLYGMKAPDFKNAPNIIMDAIKDALQDEGIREDIITEYLSDAGKPVFGKTTSRGILTQLAQAAYLANCFSRTFKTGKLVQTGFNLYMGSYLFTISKELEYPIEVLLPELEKRYGKGKPVVQERAFQFLITLQLDKHKVWRRVIVPAGITFRKLHHIIQDAMGWKDSHLHEFTIIKDDKPIASITCDEETMHDTARMGHTAELDDQTLLAEYFPEYNQFIYLYDFGDDWEHRVLLEKIQDDYPYNYPICIEGEGACPPEDVGGETGFEDFLAAYNNPKHSGHKEAVEWAGIYNDQFDCRGVNFDLRYALIHHKHEEGGYEDE